MPYPQDSHSNSYQFSLIAPYFARHYLLNEQERALAVTGGSNFVEAMVVVKLLRCVLLIFMIQPAAHILSAATTFTIPNLIDFEAEYFNTQPTSTRACLLFLFVTSLFFAALRVAQHQAVANRRGQLQELSDLSAYFFSEDISPPVRSFNDNILCELFKEIKRDSDDIPAQYLCQLSHEVMTDPVEAPGLPPVERYYIERVLQKSQINPFTKLPLKIADLQPCNQLREEIENYRDALLQEHRSYSSNTEALFEEVSTLKNHASSAATITP